MRRKCPICGGESRFYFEKFQRQIFFCQNCGLKFVWPIPSPKEIEPFYRQYWRKKSFRGEKALGYLSYLAEKESFLDYFRKVFRQINPAPGRVLDIGCGPGFFLKIAQEKGWQVWGLDLSKEAVVEARKILKTRRIYRKTLNDCNFLPNFFDLVVIFQTIEHAQSPLELLKKARKILKPRGLLLLTTPNTSGWQAKIMGRHWFSYRHPDHFWFFSQKSLEILLRQAGFAKIRKGKDPARVYELGWLLEILPYYLKGKFWQKLSGWLKKILGKGGKIKIPFSLDSLLIFAQKE